MVIFYYQSIRNALLHLKRNLRPKEFPHQTILTKKSDPADEEMQVTCVLNIFTQYLPLLQLFLSLVPPEFPLIFIPTPNCKKHLIFSSYPPPSDSSALKDEP